MRQQRAPSVWVTAIAALAALAVAPVVGAATADSAPVGFIVGTCVSLRDGAGTLPALQRIKAQSLRLDLPWKQVEPTPAQFVIPASIDALIHEAAARHIEPLVILAYGNPAYGADKPVTPEQVAAFTRYAVYAVTQLKGVVRYFDLWNEWNARTGATTPGTPDSYVALARVVYAAIKRANPEAVVLSGGISDLSDSGLEDSWLGRYLSIGGLAYTDGLSLHPYNFMRGENGTPESAIRLLDRIHAMAARQSGAIDVPIYITEFGYPTHDGKGAVPANTAASFASRFLLLASTRDYVRGVWWYGLRDQGTEPANKEHHFGLLDFTFQAKPAANAFTTTVDLLGRYGRFRTVQEGAFYRVAAAHAGSTALTLHWQEHKSAGPKDDAGAEIGDASGNKR